MQAGATVAQAWYWYSCASLKAAPCGKWHIALLPRSTLFSGFFRSVTFLAQTSFVLRFRIRLMRFDDTICHVPGKHLYTAEPFHVPLLLPQMPSLARRVHRQSCLYRPSPPIFQQGLTASGAAQEQDSICSQLIAFCKHGWPNNDQLTRDLLWYWSVREELFLHDDLLLWGHHIVVPQSPQQETLHKIHSGHQRILWFCLHVSSAAWWPGIKHQVEQLVRSWPACTQAHLAHRQPMISFLPNHPWEKVASDLFELNGKTYLLVADYFSCYLEVQTLTTTTSASVIRALKAIFSRHGIPAVLMSDKGPQYSSQKMKDFANQYNFKHVTSSPHYPQCNGMAERMVKTAKSLLEKSADPYLALLAYKTTRLPWWGHSPAQPTMGRPLRTDIPQVPSTLTPKWSYLTSFHQKMQRWRENRTQTVIAATELGSYWHCPTVHQFRFVLKTDQSWTRDPVRWHSSVLPGGSSIWHSPEKPETSFTTTCSRLNSVNRRNSGKTLHCHTLANCNTRCSSLQT